MYNNVLIETIKNINVLVCIAAYLIGSIPFGVILSKYFYGINIQKEGSLSIGATNVLRVLKKYNPKKAKTLAIATIILDVLKAIIPILIAKFTLNISQNTIYTMGVLAVLGHCFSIYLKFEGGKGVATGAGVISIFAPYAAIISIFTWFIIGKVFKISSLASLSAAIVAVISIFVIYSDNLALKAPTILIVLIIFYKHVPNIKRLILKQEKQVI